MHWQIKTIGWRVLFAFEKIYQVETPVELTGLFEEAYLAATRKEEEDEE